MVDEFMRVFYGSMGIKKTYTLWDLVKGEWFGNGCCDTGE